MAFPPEVGSLTVNLPPESLRARLLAVAFVDSVVRPVIWALVCVCDDGANVEGLPVIAVQALPAVTCESTYDLLATSVVPDGVVAVSRPVVVSLRTLPESVDDPETFVTALEICADVCVCVEGENVDGLPVMFAHALAAVTSASTYLFVVAWLLYIGSPTYTAPSLPLTISVLGVATLASVVRPEI